MPLKDEVVGQVRAELNIIAAAVGSGSADRLRERHGAVACPRRKTAIGNRCQARARRESTSHSAAVRRGESAPQFIRRSLGDPPRGVGSAADHDFAILATCPAANPSTSMLTVLGIALLVTLLTSLLLAWGPSALFSRLDVTSALRSGRAQVGKSSRRGLQVLIAVRDFSRPGADGQRRDCCFAASGWRNSPTPDSAPSNCSTPICARIIYDATGAPFYKQVLESVSSLPGVEATGVSDCVPATWAPNREL